MISERPSRLDTLRVVLGALLVFVLSCATLLTMFSSFYFPVQSDETSLVWQSKLAAQGYLPYRDYFAFKPPLLLYLNAGVFSLFGSTMGELRLFSVVLLAGSAVLLFLLGVRASMKTRWAVCIALILPALMVPQWPVPSGHWTALPFGLASLLCVATPRPRTGAVFAAGALAALAGLCTQTHGVVFAGLLAIRLLSDPETRGLRTLAAAAAGILVPLLLAVALLASAGFLREAFEHVVLWPGQYYRQPGGFNDLTPRVAPSAAVSGMAAVVSVVGTPGVLATLLHRVVLTAFAVGLPAIATVSSILMWRRGLLGPRAAFALLGFLLLWLVFSRGRPDLVHLVFLGPVFLYLLVQHIDWQADVRRPPLLRVWVALALLLMLGWPVTWLREPPSIAGVVSVDAQWAARGLPTLVADLPEVTASALPVLHLSPYASGLYIQWAPVPPPVDWLIPPSDRYNSPLEWQAFADFADEHRVPYIIVLPTALEAWLRDPSPIRELLRERYQRAFDTRWGVAYCRIGAVAPRTGEAICDLPRPSIP